MQLDDVAWDDSQEPLDDAGPCEFSAGVVLQLGQPRILLCRKPGRLRGIAYACDDCWSSWRERKRK